MQMLGQYQTTTDLTNKDAGSCRWCFAQKGGKAFFIKEFLGPKYPENDTMSSPAQIEKRKRDCRNFEQRKMQMYSRINAHSDGNAVRVEELFRVGSRYYMAMERVQADPKSIEEIAAFGENMHRRLCRIIAHSVMGLHEAGFVHSDLKHTNIMFSHAKSRWLTAKVIDYDAGFLEEAPPGSAEEIAGDPVYFSPEVCCALMGMPAKLSCKIDIFALGVLFHQYFTGKLPEFDRSRFTCAGEAAAMESPVTVDRNLPEDIRVLLSDMLEADPDKRPTAKQVFAVLSGQKQEEVIVIEEEEEKPATGFVGDAFGRSGFFQLDDLN